MFGSASYQVQKLLEAKCGLFAPCCRAPRPVRPCSNCPRFRAAGQWGHRADYGARSSCCSGSRSQAGRWVGSLSGSIRARSCHGPVSIWDA